MVQVDEDELKSLQPTQINTKIVAFNNENPIVEKFEISKKSNNEFRMKSVFIQIIMSILVNISVFSSGMGLGFPAITYHALINGTDSMTLSIEEASWFASINAIACPFGGLLSSFLLDLIGRKNTLYTINGLSIISWGIIATSSTSNKDIMYIQLLLARIIIGITTGLTSAPASVYSAEIAYPSLRGRLVAFTSTGIALGVLIIYTLGYFIPTDWRLVSGISCLICVFAAFLIIFIPESPKWFASKGRIADAERSLRSLRGLPKIGNIKRASIQEELDNLVQQSAAFNEQQETESICEKLRKPEVYKPLGIMIGFFGFSQFSGVMVIVVFAANFCELAGVTIDPFLCVVIIGTVRVITTFFTGYLMDKLGRRSLAMLSGSVMTICMFGLAAVNKYPVTTLSWLPVAFIIVYIIGNTLGLLTLPFTMISEIYPQKIRGFASGLTICAAYFMCFIIVKLYPIMVQVLGPMLLFIFYGSVSMFSIVYIYYVLPETKGKSLQEIENLFKKPSLVKNRRNNEQI